MTSEGRSIRHPASPGKAAQPVRTSTPFLTRELEEQLAGLSGGEQIRPAGTEADRAERLWRYFFSLGGFFCAHSPPPGSCAVSGMLRRLHHFPSQKSTNGIDAPADLYTR